MKETINILANQIEKLCTEIKMLRESFEPEISTQRKIISERDNIKPECLDFEAKCNHTWFAAWYFKCAQAGHEYFGETRVVIEEL